MSTIHLSASELAPVVHVLAAAIDGARATMANRKRAADMLAPVLVANARAWNRGIPAADQVKPVSADDLLAACSESYCLRNPLRRDTVRALRELAGLRYNCDTLSMKEQGALLDAYALCSRVAVGMMSVDD